MTFSCSQSTSKKIEFIHFVPDDASLIIKTSNLSGLMSSLNNNDFIQKLRKSKSVKAFNSKLQSLDLLNSKYELLLCISTDIKDSLQYTIITKHHEGLFKRDSLKNYSEELFTYKNKSIIKSNLNNNIFYSTIIDSVFIASSSKSNIENAHNSGILDLELEKIYKTTTNDQTLSLILRPNQTLITSLFIEEDLPLKSFSNYLAVDVDITQDAILINGITKGSDSTKSIINVFKKTIPQENQIQNVTPSNSDGFMSFTFSDFKNLEKNLRNYHDLDSIKNTSTLFDNIIEVGVIYEAANSAVVLNSLDILSTNDALLSEQTTIDTFRGLDIFEFSQPSLFYNHFKPLISFKNATKYCVLDNFFVFADNLELLQNIIANYQNTTTFSERAFFKTIKTHLSDASSLLLVVNDASLKSILNKNISGDFKLDQYNASAIQFIFDTNFAHVHGIIKKSRSAASENSISEILNIKLDADLLISPQFVTNYLSNEKEIVVQDVNNNLYLISNKGKILWKKQLQGPVLGSIEQIDIYKNGRLQLVFATPKRIYVIDRNGKDVAPFPSKFNDNITQPLALFDYDHNKNYRLLVTQGKSVLMYDVKAKIVKGFTFKSAKETINTKPQHFRIGNKDYITIKTDREIYILDRTGKTRVRPKSSHSLSNQSMFLYNNTFTTSSKNGDLISIDTRGNVSIKKLNLGESHHIDATSKTLVTLSDNKLSIKSKSIELDFGIYSEPKLFYINDKIYVTITDLQSQKIYLYDSQAKLIDNFPIYGQSAIVLDNVDKDKNLEFVTKGESNSIILYEMN